MTVRVILSPVQRRLVDKGGFVRVDLGREERPFRSVLVGRVDGVWRAYANVCRHRALPLDLGRESPMSDDGRFLLCGQHGALYRPADGECFAGPCAGEKLVAIPVAEDVTPAALVLDV